MLESLAKANPISKAISKAISGGLAVERTKKHIKAKATAATEIVTKVHEWTDPDTVIVYAYEEDGELKIVKTQQLSEEESQKYQLDSQN